MTWCAITWNHQGRRYLIDADTREMAAAIGVALAEQRRRDVAVTEIEEPAVDAEQRLRIAKRIEERLYEQGYYVPLREALGA